ATTTGASTWRWTWRLPTRRARRGSASSTPAGRTRTLRSSGPHRDHRPSPRSAEPPGAHRREASGPHTAAHVLTPRLRLDAVVPGDLDGHFALMSAPRGWGPLPAGGRTH